MAIIEVVPGIQVSVLISGKAAPEFPDPGTDAPSGCRTTTRYIESRDDATFAVHVAANSDYDWVYKSHAVKAVLFVDGGYVENCIIGEMGASETLHGPRRYAVSTGEWSARGMKFSSVRTVEEPDTKISSISQVHELFTRISTKDNNRANLTELGSIKVEIYRGKVVDSCVPRITASLAGSMTGSPSPHSGDSKSPAAAPTKAHGGVFEVCEKSLKGRTVTHGSTFSAPKRVAGATDVRFEPLAEDQGPIAIFRFLYKSEETLLREGIKLSYTQALSGRARAPHAALAKKSNSGDRRILQRANPLSTPDRDLSRKNKAKLKVEPGEWDEEEEAKEMESLLVSLAMPTAATAEKTHLEAKVKKIKIEEEDGDELPVATPVAVTKTQRTTRSARLAAVPVTASGPAGGGGGGGGQPGIMRYFTKTPATIRVSPAISSEPSSSSPAPSVRSSSSSSAPCSATSPPLVGSELEL